MVFLDKYDYPVETIKGRWVQNFIRRLIHTRRIVMRQLVFCRHNKLRHKGDRNNCEKCKKEFDDRCKDLPVANSDDALRMGGNKTK